MPVVLIGLAIAFGTMLVLGGSDIDRGLAMLGRGETQDILRGIARGVAAWTPAPALLGIGLVGVGALAAMARWRQAVAAGVVVAGGYAVAAWLRMILAPLRVGLDDRIAGSFPNLPATTATLSLFTAALLIPTGPRARPIAMAAAMVGAILIGLAQSVGGRGWPSDVIGGWALALFWLLLVLTVGREPALRPPPRFKGPWDR